MEIFRSQGGAGSESLAQRFVVVNSGRTRLFSSKIQSLLIAQEVPLSVVHLIKEVKDVPTLGRPELLDGGRILLGLWADFHRSDSIPDFALKMGKETHFGNGAVHGMSIS